MSTAEPVSVTEPPERINVAQDSDGFWTCREAVIGSQEYVRADIERGCRYEALRLKAELASISHVQAPAGEDSQPRYTTARMKQEKAASRRLAIVECLEAIPETSDDDSPHEAVLNYQVALRALLASPTPQIDEAMVERARRAYYETVSTTNGTKRNEAMRRALQAAIGGGKS